MKKKKTIYDFLKDYWGIIVALIVIGILIYFFFFTTPSISYQNCLEKYAMEYCNENDMSYNSLNAVQQSFFCNSNDDIYRKIGNKIVGYYFLSDEINICEIYK